MHTLVVGPFEVNCYLYWADSNRHAVVIDPGSDSDAILASIEELELIPKAILLTHGHADHIAAVKRVKETHDLPLYIGEGEEDLLAHPSANISAFFDNPIVAPPADIVLKHGEILNPAGFDLKVLATPGHTGGGVCYYDEEMRVCFTGDTLFAGGIGRTDLPGGSFNTLLSSIREKLLALPDVVDCYPGHGPATTIGEERTTNPFLVGGDFV